LPFEPFPVHVLEPPGGTDLSSEDSLTESPTRILAWCDLYQTRERAEEIARQGEV
jgi:hypothetical protein